MGERHFDTELNQVKNRLMEMGLLVEDAIRKAVESLRQRDIHSAEAVIVDDKRIDEMELTLDEQCLDLLALRQPMASDLRFITMVMKITTDLERMADLAVDIAQRVKEIYDQPLLKPLIDIPKLSRLAQDMTCVSIDAFVMRDTAKAGKVILLDGEADTLKNNIQEELIRDYLSRDTKCAVRAVALLLIARHLERICDHATNIAEDVIYMVNASVIKHHKEKLADT
ncbi:MAG TPA: phosphate signaling complex protein PhoU [Candidatus Omnitrophota bacterium]|nr:phosphate signaling complex protein PhoU [Candidatus Omnitrophota bacterium]